MLNIQYRHLNKNCVKTCVADWTHNMTHCWQKFLLACATLTIFLCTTKCSELLQYDAAKDGPKEIKEVDASFFVDKKSEKHVIRPAKDGAIKDEPESSADIQATKRQLDYSFLHAFIASISVIIVSELGDKTFFIAAIMAMRHSRIIVFTGAIGALGLMTVLSVFLGYATTVIPRVYTFYISTALFAIFGLKMLKEGYDMDPNEGQEELEEVSAELKKKEAEMEAAETSPDVETGFIGSKIKRSKLYRLLSHFCSPILIQAFTMTFLAEWGDRSQLTTIILGSRENPLGVAIGGTIGHALCTGLAVLGGRLIAQKISVRTVTLIGGVVFLIFAASALFLGHE
ncbi:transmembrane protein 165-like isoform X2 [Hydractinia symbiolongicarpus]|uniref:transmembrane protein 165-like isoform X2 n=1 Tax=Hydractinia symbiolongicarpus TaxID=13093 RepID=UPI00254D3A4D|nr:transmembrane protein 165-like isoform X2 [Hydractinia symbiolongicarpus]